MNFMKSIYAIICSGFNLEIDNVSIIKDSEIIVYLANNTTASVSLEKNSKSNRLYLNKRRNK